MNTKAKSGETAGDEETTDVEALNAEIRRLRADVASLVETVGRIGRGQARGLVRAAEGKAGEGLAAGEAALADLGSEIEKIEHDIATATRRSPFRALGLAAGAGFVLALILRR